jgi:Recombinase/Recombinase zinc beta ribbon domain
MRAAGASYNEVAAFLTEKKVQPRKGRSGTYTHGWSRGGVTHLLRNRVYLGEVSAEGVVNRDAHSAIVDEAVFVAAQRSSGARPSRESRHPFWLTRVARCAGCGAGLLGVIAHPKGPDYDVPVYRCQTRGCPAPASISARKLEPFVEERLLAWLGSAERAIHAAVGLQADAEIAALEDRRAELEREVEAWRRMPVADIDPRFFAEGLRERVEPLEETLARIGELRSKSPGVTLSATIPDGWSTLDVVERRRIVRAAVSRIVATKAGLRVPLDDRVEIVDSGGEPLLFASAGA